MTIQELNGGDCKTYIVVSGRTREAALIDPLLNRTPAYLDLLRREGLKLRFAIDTHTHADHLSGCADLADRLGAEYAMGKGGLPACVSRRLEHGETLSFGDAALRFLETPGHTTDSVSLEAEGAFFSGDFLFIGALGAGRLDLPGGDPAVHFSSLERLDGLSDAVRLLPGHDYQGKTESTLGAERRVNPVLEKRTREAYVEWWRAKKLGPAAWMGGVVRANRNCTTDPDSVLIPSSEGACASACAAGPVPAAHGSEAVPGISAEELSALLGDPARAPFVLDVRGVEEFEGALGHLPGSVLIPLNQLSWRMDEIPKDKPVAVVCGTGARAARAAVELMNSGYGKLWVLTGGVEGWRRLGF